MEPRSRCNNAIHVLNHFKKLGIEESVILDGLSVDKDYLSNPHNWLTVKDWYKMIDNCQDAAPLTTLNDWFKVAFFMKDNQESKLFEMITKLVGVRNMFRLAPQYINSFNTYMDLKLISLGSNHAEYITRTNDSVISKGAGLMVRFTSGVCSIIPYIIHKKAATVDIQLDQAPLKNIIKKLYKFYDLTYSEKNGYIFINGEVIGRQIQLLKSPPGEYYSNKYSFEKPCNAILITKDLVVDGLTLLNKDDIFDAPYGRVRFEWENRRSFFDVFGNSKLKNEILAHLNEQLFLAEQRHFESEQLRAREIQYIKQLKFTLSELASIEERERRSIAEELHDTVAQTMGFGITKLNAFMDKKKLREDPEFKDLHNTFLQALNNIRSLTVQISPPVLHMFGLEKAFEDLSYDISHNYGIQVEFFNNIEESLDLDDTLKTILYRSVRELFINTTKHSKSKKAELSISYDSDLLIIEYCDSGVGFDTGILKDHRYNSCFGLYSISERIRILNGEFNIKSQPGAGVKIMIAVPIKQDDISNKKAAVPENP